MLNPNMGKRVFSYCIYGNAPKYCVGMIKNIEQISLIYPDYDIWIHCGNDVSESYLQRYRSYPTVRLIRYPFTGGRLMTYRLFCMDYDSSIDVMISRDADSRFEKRDHWCISNFLNSEYKVFTIRDHPWHGHPIMGGLCGFKRIEGLSLQKAYTEYTSSLSETDKDKYYSDQNFLSKYVYSVYVSIPTMFIAYTSRRFSNETTRSIEQPRETPYDFCGNVVLFKEDDSEVYEFTL